MMMMRRPTAHALIAVLMVLAGLYVLTAVAQFAHWTISISTDRFDVRGLGYLTLLHMACGGLAIGGAWLLSEAWAARRGRGAALRAICGVAMVAPGLLMLAVSWGLPHFAILNMAGGGLLVGAPWVWLAGRRRAAERGSGRAS